MKSLLTIFLLATILFCGCNTSKKDKTPDDVPAYTGENTIINTVEKAVNILGSYVGSFGNNKITLLITKALGDTIVGRSIVGGNDRPFAGTFIKKGEMISINAKEPGSDKNDGVFEMSINLSKPNEVTGSWKPNNATASVKAKTFTLDRKEFRYLQDVGQYPQASKIILKDEDVSNLMKSELQFMRNEIFARHGYCFQKRDLRQQFENLDWYIPNTIDVKNLLTEIEKKNITLIKKYEQYAVEYGDDFGR
jgi:hypothetical protein